MKQNNAGREEGGKKSFHSIRRRFFAIYITLLASVVILVALVVPTLFRNYLIGEKMRELEKMREVVSNVIINEDFRKEQAAARVIEGAAQAAGVSVWIVTPIEDNTVLISVFGQMEDQNKKIDFSVFTDEEKEYVKYAVSGTNMPITLNAFPSAFDLATLSCGYQQQFVVYEPIPGRIGEAFPVQKTGAVFLHMANEGMIITARNLWLMMLSVLLLVAVCSFSMTTLMTANILEPVSALKDAAEAITKGDLNQEVEIRHYDEIGALTESFNTMVSEIRQADAMQADFIANISHDFRSPLTSIKGYVEAMLDGTIPPELHDKYLQIVLDEANRLTKMTNNVLDLTKMENGQIELHPSVWDINETIISLALSLEKRVEEKKINMDFQFLQEKLYVYADLDLIQRVIYNLLDNALKFTEEGDTIRVETSIVGRKAYIVVEDTGLGIEEEMLGHVFERFRKGDKSRGKNKMGTGLGLAIVKQIMLTHHEDIWVYSKEGQGTRFSFTLPLGSRERSQN